MIHILITQEIKRYAIVASCAFAVDYSVLFLLTSFVGLNYLISSGISFIFGVSVMYLFSISWIFSKRSITKQKLEIIIFFITSIVGLVGNIFLMWVCTDLLSVFYLLSKIIVTFIIFIWNYLSKKILVFS